MKGHTGERSPNFRRKIGEEYGDKISKTLKGRKRIIPIWNKGLTKETDIRVEKNIESIILSRNKLYEKGKTKWWNTDIEIILKKAFKKEKIKFKHQIYIKGIGRIDFLLDNKVIVECDGDYPHANPKFHKATELIYGRIKAKDIWKKNKEQNKRAKKLGYIVLRFWGNDIKNNINKCIEKIKEVIK
jgi:very-short-patch-repair endonuclease